MRHFSFAVELKKETAFLTRLISRIYRSQPQNHEILLQAAVPVVIFSRYSLALSLFKKDLKKVDFSIEGFLHKKNKQQRHFCGGPKEDIQ